MFTKAFLKDAAERFLATFVAVVIGALAGAVATPDFGLDKMGEKTFWVPILVTSGVTAAKALLAYLRDPNSGASLGTAVPSGQVVAAVDVKSEETVASDASTIPNGTPVHVITDLPPVPPVS